MLIRKATPEETKEILEHAYTVMKEATMGLVEKSKAASSDMMNQALMNGGYFLVCEDRGTIKGWLGLGEFYNADLKEMAGALLELYVFPEQRNQGIAKRLLEDALDRFKAKGLKKVHLSVYTGNPIKHLYERLGFQEIVTMMEKNLG